MGKCPSREHLGETLQSPPKHLANRGAVEHCTQLFSHYWGSIQQTNWNSWSAFPASSRPLPSLTLFPAAYTQLQGEYRGTRLLQFVIAPPATPWSQPYYKTYSHTSRNRPPSKQTNNQSELVIYVT
eukprot:sb/3475539/